MTQATQLGYCESCRAEVEAAKNHHRLRNTAAANFAAANLQVTCPDFNRFGGTGRYVCPHCGSDVKPGTGPGADTVGT